MIYQTMVFSIDMLNCQRVQNGMLMGLKSWEHYDNEATVGMLPSGKLLHNYGTSPCY